MDTVAGCEGHNLTFFLQRGGAVTADTPRLLADTAMALLADPERLRAMLRPAEAQTPAEQIYDCLCRPQTRLDTAQRYA